MVFSYLVTTGWIFDINLLCENSINQSINQVVVEQSRSQQQQRPLGLHEQRDCITDWEAFFLFNPPTRQLICYGIVVILEVTALSTILSLPETSKIYSSHVYTHHQNDTFPSCPQKE